jgi:shikimate kinase
LERAAVAHRLASRGVTLKLLLDRRRPLYEQVATLTVATDGRTPEEVAAEVLAGLMSRR